MTKPKRTAIAASPAMVHENFLRAREAGLVMREADFRRRYHTVKHGLSAGVCSIEETMAALGEDPAEFEAFARLIERTFVPGTCPSTRWCCGWRAPSGDAFACTVPRRAGKRTPCGRP